MLGKFQMILNLREQFIFFCPVQKVTDGLHFFSVRSLIFQDCFMVSLDLRRIFAHSNPGLFPEVSEVGSSSGMKALPPTVRRLAIWPTLGTKNFYQSAGVSSCAASIERNFHNSLFRRSASSGALSEKGFRSGDSTGLSEGSWVVDK